MQTVAPVSSLASTEPAASCAPCRHAIPAAGPAARELLATRDFRLRRFVLRRTEDVSGCSGTGIVAEGIEFSTGKCAVGWLPGVVGVSSAAIYDSIGDVIILHGHNGRTVVEYVDLLAAHAD